jgi:hypothetical protein
MRRLPFWPAYHGARLFTCWFDIIAGALWTLFFLWIFSALFGNDPP